MAIEANHIVVDADAHVVECARTWNFMDPSEQKYRPLPLEPREEAGVRLQFWVIDGKVRGFRFPAFSSAELEKRQQQVGRTFADVQESRELATLICACSTWMTPASTFRCCTTPCSSNRPRIARGRSGVVQELEPLACPTPRTREANPGWKTTKVRPKKAYDERQKVPMIVD